MVDCSLRFFKCLTQDFIITKLNLNFQQVQELILLGQRRLFVLLQHLLAMGDNGTLQIQLPSRRRAPSHLYVEVSSENGFRLGVLPDDGEQRWIVGWREINWQLSD